MGILPTLLLKYPGCAGVYQINGQPLGEVTRQEDVLALPASPEGACDIIFWPYADCPPLLRRVSFHRGRPIAAPGLPDVIAWPDGLCEVTLNVDPPQPYPRSPRVLCQANWEDLHAALLAEDKPLLLIEDENGRMVFEYVPPQAKSARFESHGSRLVLCGGDGAREWALALQKDGQEITVALEQSGGEVRIPDENCLFFYTPLEDVAAHIRVERYQWDGGSYAHLGPVVEYALRVPRAPRTREQTALAFAQALALGLDEEAFGYLSQDLRADLTAEQLRAYLGNFDGCLPPRAVFADEQTPLYLYTQELSLRRVRLHRCSLIEGVGVTPYLIDNIEESANI